MKHILPPLPYSYDALEPHIDERTMEIHYTKHHQAYVDKLNQALEKYPDLGAWPLEELLRSTESVPETIRSAVRNHGGGHFNHSLFWPSMAPSGKGGGREAQGVLGGVITKAFGSFASFREKFTSTALGVFGSGWAWLVVNAAGTLEIISTPNQDSPVSSGLKPILGLALCEHTYYLKH